MKLSSNRHYVNFNKFMDLPAKEKLQGNHAVIVVPTFDDNYQEPTLLPDDEDYNYKF